MAYAVHGILQARILEWVAFPFSRGSFQPRNRTQVSHIAGGFFTRWATREAQNIGVGSLSLLQGIFPTLECGRPGFNSCVGKIPWRRKRLPTPVFWPRDSMDCIVHWGCKELDTTERLSLSSVKELQWDKGIGQTVSKETIRQIYKVREIAHNTRFLFFFFWPHHAACGISVPWPGTEPM